MTTLPFSVPLSILPWLCLFGGMAPCLLASDYHVDALAGHDRRGDGSIGAPWRTLEQVNHLALKPGDRVLLRAGRVWTNQWLDLTASGTAENPIVVDRYGEGADPIIDFGDISNTRGEAWGVRLRNCSFLEINHLAITSGRFADSRLRNGVWVTAEGVDRTFCHIHLRDIKVYDVFGNSRRTGGINFHVRRIGDNLESTFDDVLIEGCTVDNVADTGIQLMTDALLGPTTWRHQFDAFRDVRIRNCRVTNVNRDGILVRASPGAFIAYNVVGYAGYLRGDLRRMPYIPKVEFIAALWPYYSDGVVMRFNEAYGTRLLRRDGQAWDFDVGVSNSVYEYNYSHDNEGGLLLVMNGTANNSFCRNISQDDRGDLMDILGDGTQVHDNTFYRGPGVARNKYFCGNMRLGARTISYRNNLFVNLAGAPYFDSPSASYERNLFFGLHPRSEPKDALKITSGWQQVESGVSIVGVRTAVSCRVRGKNGTNTADAVAAAYNQPLLLSYSFAQAKPKGWVTVRGDWSVTKPGDGFPGLSPGIGPGIAVAPDGPWRDLTLEGTVKLVSGTCGLVFHYEDPQNYCELRLSGAGTLELLQVVSAKCRILSIKNVDLNPAVLHRLKVIVDGASVYGYLDDVWTLAWKSPPLHVTVGSYGLSGSDPSTRVQDLRALLFRR
ncbi:hypothetical protein GALL_41890 [mine drainage metagenome]|uniref:Right handed beta helix domain-containing protein n=1 Tax=mine drainage metagenome TaxID=410659 RepID=A0A1J5TSQ8_9ZZZZ